METKNPSAYEMLNKILELLEHMNAKMEQFILDQVISLEPDEHKIEKVECYVSKSGNITWKAYTTEGKLIYLRQAHRELLESSGLWSQLAAMDIGEACETDITLYTIPDGDFLKVVDVSTGGVVYAAVPQKQKKANDDTPLDVQRLADMVESDNFVVIDTETTHLHGYVCSLAVIASNGTKIIDKLIKPPVEITDGAAAVHGITNDMVADAPEFPDVAADLLCAIKHLHMVGWNINYDIDAILRSARHYGLRDFVQLWEESPPSYDVMEPFAQVYGEWSDYHQSYTFQKLTTAAAYYGIDSSGAHNALADARMTLKVLRHMVAATTK